VFEGLYHRTVEMENQLKNQYIGNPAEEPTFLE
jgi:hypothetical protein